MSQLRFSYFFTSYGAQASKACSALISNNARHTECIAVNRKECILVVEFANSVDLNEEAHYELPHLDLHCLPYSL